MTGAEHRARLLADLATALTTSVADLGWVLDTAARAACSLIGDSGMVRLAGPDGFMAEVAVHHPDPDRLAIIRALVDVPGQRVEDGVSGAVAASGRVYVNNNIRLEELTAATPQRLHEALARLDLHAMIIAPLLVDGRYLGFLAAGRLGTTNPYSDADVELAEDIAARVALAVATAHSIARLAASEDRYRRILDNSLEGIWEVDLDGNTVYANPRVGQMLGVPVDRLLGAPASPWILEADEAALAARWAARKAGRSELYETRLRRVDGTELWVQVAGTPMRERDGTVTGMLAMLTDISDRVEARQLQQRLDQMSRLDSLGQLAGGVAHDFNNLLSIIGGFTDLLRGELDPGGAAAELADQISAAVAKAAALTRQLMTFGRGQQGTADTIEIGEVIDTLRPMLARTLGEHITITVAPGPGTCFVRIDRGHLEQALVNLAVNARDAMTGGGTLRIEHDLIQLGPRELADPDLLTGDTSAGDTRTFVRLTVSDTGHGMNADTLARACDPFFTTKKDGHGTGLGLAGVYSTIRNAGGTLHLSSTPGHGTTVRICLPAHTAAETRPTGNPTTPPAPHPGARILVVEDQPELAEVIKRLLTRAGHHVTAVHHPHQALTHLASGAPVDLLITDVIMPDMTGPELVATLAPEHPHLPVIFASGYAAGHLGDRADINPDATVLAKPFTRDTLLSAVEAALPPPG